MSERMAAEICIGGAVPHRLAEELCAVVRDIGASLEWGGSTFAPRDSQELLQARDDGHLHLYDDQRSWGEFADLEAFLQKKRIPYDRQTAGRYEYDAEMASFRPGIGLEVIPTNGAGHPVVESAALEPALDSLAALGKYVQGGKCDMPDVLRRLQRLEKLLRSKLPPPMPPLEPFVIRGD